MMGLWGMGMGVGMIFVVIFWVAVIGCGVWLVGRLFPGMSSNRTPSGDVQVRANTESPLEILKRRYAAGEISKTEFEDMQRDLQALER